MHGRSLPELCEILRKYGFSPDLHADGHPSITGVATLEDAQPGQISFLSNPKYERVLATTRASAVVLKPDVEAPPHLGLIRVPDPYAAITALIVELHGYRRHAPVRNASWGPSISPRARIGPHATIHPGVTIEENVVIGANAVIYPGCYIGPRCRIGDNLLLYPNVVIYDDTIIGNRVTIHAGTVIGNDGLGYAPMDGKWVKIPQIGIVEIADDVEIGANCAIDRATLGRTYVGAGTKFSNLIAIGHGTRIGESCMLVAQVGVAGSVTVGDHVTMAGQAGVVGHVRIGDKAVIGAKAGVTNDVEESATVLGAPAIPIRDKRREVALLARLPQIWDSIKAHEKQLAELEKRLSEAECESQS